MWIVCAYEGSMQSVNNFEHTRRCTEKRISCVRTVLREAHQSHHNNSGSDGLFVSYKLSLMCGLTTLCSAPPGVFRCSVIHGMHGIGHRRRSLCVAECVPEVPIDSSLLSFRQSVEREYRRSAQVVKVSRYILRIPNSATEAWGFSLR